MRTNPVVLNDQSDSGQELSRIEARPKGDLDEAWLRRLIFSHPEILPVSEFDDAAHGIVPVAMELPTAAGSIDDFFISSNGTIVIVETKLWKNPEKHRTVVAQIIDYAKELNTWSFDELDEAVKKTSLKAAAIAAKDGILDILRQHVEEAGIGIDEFQERVQQRLRGGEFVLLIIGDRISPNVAFLTDWLGSAPGLNFRLGLVELQLYPLESDSDWPILVVPDIVGRTVEKTRGVVKIKYEKEEPFAEVEYAEPDEPVIPKGKTTQDEFLSKLQKDVSPVYERWFDKWFTIGFIVYWGVAGFSLRIQLGSKPQTVLDAYPDWATSVIRQVDAEKLSVPTELYKEYLDVVKTVPGASATLASGKRYIKPQAITPDELDVIFTATTRLAENLLSKWEEKQ